MRNALAIIFITSIVLFPAFRPSHADNRIALVVGVSDYGGASLANPLNDAGLINSALKNANFETTLLNNPTLEYLLEAVNTLKQLASEKGKDTTVVFYFAGHGFQVNGNNYLVPANSDLVQGSHSEAAYDARSLKAQNVLDRLSETIASRILLVLDVCRANPVRPGHRGAKQVRFAQMHVPDTQKSMIIFSTEATQEASDGLTGEKNSPFTSAFVDEIRKPGQDIPDVFLNVQDRVRLTTNNEQHPWVQGLFHFQFAPAVSASDAMTTASVTTGPGLTATPAPPVTARMTPQDEEGAQVEPASITTDGTERTGEPQLFSDLHGVIEIGTNGVKATWLQLSKEHAIEIEHDTSDDVTGIKYQKLEQYRNKEMDTELKESFKEDNTELFDARNIDRTINAVDNFFRIFKDKTISRKNIHVVASSGTSLLPHFEEFKTKLESALNIHVETISAGRECELTFRWVTPNYRYNDAVVVYIGSASVCAGYLERAPDKFRSLNLLDTYGTKTFKQLVEKSWDRLRPPAMTFAEAAARQRIEIIEPELLSKLRSNPGLITKRRLYLVGGIVWATTSFVRPMEFAPEHSAQKPWIPIRSSDIGIFWNRLNAKGDSWERIDYSGVSELQRKAISENLKDVRRVFRDKEDFISGLQLLHALRTKLGWDNKDAIFFSHVARDGWRTQYLIDRISGRPVQEARN